MSPLRIQGATSGFSELAAPAVAGDQTFTLPGTGGTLDRLNRAGNILQVVNATYSTGTTNSSTTYADTGLTATIAPTSSSSKILVLVNQVGCGKDTASDISIKLRLLRGASQIVEFEKIGGYTVTATKLFIGSCSTAYLDSPATTSATTYKTQFALGFVATGTIGVQIDNSTSTITLLEVAA